MSKSGKQSLTINRKNTKMKRDDTTVIVRQEWVTDYTSYTTWLTVWAEDFINPFRLIGIPQHDFAMGRRHEYEQRFAVGSIVRIGDLAQGVPNVKWQLLANLRPGVNMQVLSMDDGLTGACGPLFLVRMVDYPDNAATMTPEMESIGRRAVLTDDNVPARRILEESGLFTFVYEFDAPVYSSVSMCFEP